MRESGAQMGKSLPKSRELCHENLYQAKSRPDSLSPVPLFFFIFLAVLGIEPRASRMLNKCSTSQLNPQALMPLTVAALKVQ